MLVSRVVTSIHNVVVPNCPAGFDYVVRGATVVISHCGRPAGVLRGPAAGRFLRDIERSDPQQVMARVTGDYKHGNESVARKHPRNADRPA